MGWGPQAAELGGSFWVPSAGENAGLGGGFLPCSWPVALTFLRLQWAHCITWRLTNKACVCV